MSLWIRRRGAAYCAAAGVLVAAGPGVAWSAAGRGEQARPADAGRDEQARPADDGAAVGSAAASAPPGPGPLGPHPLDPHPLDPHPLDPHPLDPGPLDPGSPLAPLPGLGVAWPDPETVTARPAAADVGSEAPDPIVPGLRGDAGGTAAAPAGTPAGSTSRYGYRLDGIDIPASPLLRERFVQLSSLVSNDGQPANAAQLDRRAREDSLLLTGLLRAEGYYDARVTSRAELQDGRVLVILDAAPGVRYRFASVAIEGLDTTGDSAAGLGAAFGIKPGDPVDADAVAAGETALRTRIAEQGFPFAVVGAPQIVVDHAAHDATLTMSVVSGGVRRIGRIITPPGTRPFGADHVAEIARFSTGDRYDATEIADLRRALIQTGLVSSVDVRPVAAPDPATVDLAVTMAPAPVHTIAGELGYGTGEGARAEVSWTHRNLFPPEGGLTLRGVLGTREQLISSIFRRNNFHGRDRVLTFQANASKLVRDAYRAKTFALGASLERQTNIFFQKKWTWSLGGELIASDERDVIVSTGQPRERTYFIGALPTSLTYDGSDDLLDPTRGFRLGGRLSPELSLEGKAFGYTRVQLDASAYHRVGPRVVVAGRLRLGTIFGAPRDAIAPSRRFYAGGGASVRGYSYQDIGPRDPNNAPIGGRSLAEVSIEARIRIFGAFGVVPFLDGGNISTDATPRFTSLRYGTGLGFRYYSSFGPIRIDVGTPINPQPGDARVAVYVSLGQAF